MYSTNGRNAATAATADHAVWSLWNPHATQRIKLWSFSMYAQSAAPAAGWAGRLRRISARGTPGSTVTPGREAHSTHGVAPVSGVLLDLAAFTGQPTLVSGDVSLRFVFPALQGAGVFYTIPGGIEIPPGAGVAFIQVPATASVQFDIAVSWLEDWP
jgi:hypothetical protein